MNLLRPDNFGKNDDLGKSFDEVEMEQAKKVIQEYNVGGIRMNLVDIKHIQHADERQPETRNKSRSKHKKDKKNGMISDRVK